MSFYPFRGPLADLMAHEPRPLRTLLTDTLLSRASQGIFRIMRKKNPAAVALGKLGASKGGKARAAKLSRARRLEIAMMGVRARCKKKR
jgi:hypothetical protein